MGQVIDASDILRRRPPQNQEAEENVLGAVLIDNDAYHAAARILDREDFYFDRYRLIWDAMTALANRQELIDAFTLKETLKAVGAYENSGGVDTIMRVVSQVPSAANITYYARVVRLKAVVRRAATLATEAASRCYEESPDPDFGVELIRELSWEFNKLAREAEHRDTRTKEETITAASLLMDQRKGLSLGYESLDTCFCGVVSDEITIVAARTSQGKTALATNLALNLARAGAGVGYFTLEMSEEQLWTRFLSLISGVNSFRAGRQGYIDGEVDAVEAARQELIRLPLQVHYKSRKGRMRPQDIALKCAQWQNQMPLKAIVVDYLGLMRGDQREREHWLEKGEVVTRLKEIAHEFGLSVLLLCQINREGDDDKPPRLSQLRDTGVAEEHAANVLFVWKPPAERKQFATKYTGDMVQLLIAKQRNGPAPTSIDMLFDRTTGAFSEVNNP